MVDFARYNPPGVYTQEIPGPQLGVSSAAAPRAVGIVGQGAGYLLDQETLTLAGTTSVALRRAGVSTSSVVVTNVNGTETYEVTTDYTVSVTAPGGAGTNDDIMSITRVASGSIPDGATVSVGYRYTDVEYFQPKVLYTYAEVVERYGPGFISDSSGIEARSSDVTLAAHYAILNGASRLVVVAAESSSTEDFSKALDKLNDYPDVAIIVPAASAQIVGTFTAAHVIAASGNKSERRAILGFDGTSTPVPSSERISTASSIKSDRVMVTSPDTVQIAGRNGQPVAVPGWTLAAALAGRTVSQNVAIPLTRKTLYGFLDIPGRASEAEKTQESQNGICVVEKTLQGAIRVRHGVTTDPTSVTSREWSITGQRDEQVWRIRESLDNDGLIGSIITDTTLINVKATAAAALESLVMENVIRDYQGLQVRQLVNQPDVVEVRYEWRANAPLNYIIATFSLDLTSGTVAAQA